MLEEVWTPGGLFGREKKHKNKLHPLVYSASRIITTHHCDMYLINRTGRIIFWDQFGGTHLKGRTSAQASSAGRTRWPGPEPGRQTPT